MRFCSTEGNEGESPYDRLMVRSGALLTPDPGLRILCSQLLQDRIERRHLRVFGFSCIIGYDDLRQCKTYGGFQSYSMYASKRELSTMDRQTLRLGMWTRSETVVYLVLSRSSQPCRSHPPFLLQRHLQHLHTRFPYPRLHISSKRAAKRISRSRGAASSCGALWLRGQRVGGLEVGRLSGAWAVRREALQMER